MTEVSTPVSSVAGLKSTLARHTPASVLTVVSAGQTITGATALTVTVNVHVALFIAASVVVNSTVFAPIGKVDPLASPCVCVKEAPEQLSEITGSMKVTTVPSSVIAATATSAGQVIAGSSSSVTVTVKEQSSLPAEFVAVAVTVVVPTSKRVFASCV